MKKERRKEGREGGREEGEGRERGGIKKIDKKRKSAVERKEGKGKEHKRIATNH
jgi:hypothetical protein